MRVSRVSTYIPQRQMTFHRKLYGRAVVAGQLGQLPGETVLYRIDVVSLAKQSSQYGLQIIGTVSLLNSERAPAIYHLNLHLRNGLKTLKPAIINSWFTLS